MTASWSPGRATGTSASGSSGSARWAATTCASSASMEGVRLVAVADPDATALAAAADATGAPGFAEPLAMLAEADLDAVVIAAPTTTHVAARARRDRARDRGPRREAARGDRRTRRMRIVGARRGRRACRSRSATSSGSTRRSSSSAGCSTPAGCRRVYAITSRRAGPFPARIRDVGVTIDLATHDVDILSLDRRRAADARLRRDGPADPRRPRGPAVRAAVTSRRGRSAMLDVDWLTPAKRRQLTVVGEEGMFELDYLTQRLTFTRATDMTNPRLIGGYAPTFEGEVVELPVANGEPLAAELDAFLDVVRDGGRPVVDAEDGRWAVVLADALLEPPRERPRRVELDAGRRADDDHRPRPSTAPTPARRLDRRCRPTPCRHEPARPVSPWIGEPGTAGTVAVVGAGKMGLPLAAQFASHGWRSSRSTSTRRVVDVDQRRPSRTSARSRASPSSSRDAHAAGRLRATHGRRRGRAARPTSSCSSSRSCSTTSRSPTTATWTPRSTPSRPGVHAGSTRHLRDHPAGRRHARPVRAAPRGGHRPRPLERRLRSSRSRRSGCTAAPRSATSRRTRSSSAGSARRRRPGPRRSTTRVLDAEVVAMCVGRGGRVREARRHDLPRRQHRARQRVRPLRRPDRRRHHRGDRGRQQPAVQPHPPAGPRRRRALHPGLPALPARPGARSWSSSRSSRRVNDGQVGVAIRALQRALGGLDGVDGPRPRADLPRTASRSSPTRGRCR